MFLKKKYKLEVKSKVTKKIQKPKTNLWKNLIKIKKNKHKLKKKKNRERER